MKKERSERRQLVIKPIISSIFTSRGQVDLIDYQSTTDAWDTRVWHYQAHLKKCSLRKPLKSKRAAEVVYRLLHIFLLFGTPAILQGDNGRELSARDVSDLQHLWPDLMIVRGGLDTLKAKGRLKGQMYTSKIYC